MRDLDNLQGRLASEEELLAATNRQIESAQRKIESLLQRIEDSKRQIKATEQLIEKLRGDCETTEKRMGLLRQYMELVEAESGPTTPTVRPEEEPLSQLADESEMEAGGEEAEVVSDEVLEDIEYLGEDEDYVEDDLTYVELPAAEDSEEEPEAAPTLSFDDVDENVFVLEILPRTHTFGEELLLVLAHHRKATAPKSVVRVFRRLDYAPKQPATEKNVTAQVDSNALYYEYTASGRIALTREGRTEALRLLEEYY
jgi:hypothetical protein